MLGLGFGEIILLAGIALVVMGPEKFPDFAKMAVRLVRDVRGYWDEAQRELVKEINPIKKEFKQLQKFDAEEFIDHLAGTKEVGSKKPEELDPSLAEPGASGYGVKVPEEPGADEITTPPAGDDPNDPYTLNQPYTPGGGHATDSLDAVSAALGAAEEEESPATVSEDDVTLVAEAPETAPGPNTDGLDSVSEALECVEEDEFTPRHPHQMD
jgi:Tat protein translocase TatB subunit